jgi:hypothetical protein
VSNINGKHTLRFITNVRQSTVPRPDHGAPVSHGLEINVTESLAETRHNESIRFRVKPIEFLT